MLWEEGEGQTVEGLALFLTNAFVLADEEIEFMIRTRDGADLIAGIEKVSAWD